MIKKILLTVAATAALAAAMPAAAQSYGDRDYRGGYDQRRDNDRRADDRRADDRRGPYARGDYQRQRWNDGTRREWRQAQRIDRRQEVLDERIDNLFRRRALSAAEARNFQFKLRNIEQLERGYKRHNRDLSRKEAQILNYRLDLLAREINMKARS